MFDRFQLYVERQASSPFRYVWEQSVLTLFGWVPTVLGIGLRAAAYRLILRMEGVAAVESGVRIRFAQYITLGSGSYVDQNAYLHACPNGIRIGDRSFVMHGAVLHVFNFRSLPHAGIRIGSDSLVSEYCVIRGQGGVDIGDRVYLAPSVQILAVNHVFGDPERPMIEQGITAEGVTIQDDVWIGAGAVVVDGVTLGAGSVVGAGAVVTKDVESRTVVGGSPARVIRRIEDSCDKQPEKVYL